MKLAELTGLQLRGLLEQRQTSCREVMASVLDQIELKEPELKAFLTVRDRPTLLAEAEQVDQRRTRGEPIGPLAGLPVVLKDNMCTRGLRTTCASKILANFVPPYDATVVESIRQADGVLLGKTNMDEFAMGSTTENSAVQTTRNPHHPDCVPGGSSGGSAAAVAAHMTIFALGSDTGGSIRLPASYCGVVGLKPTYGRVSRYGLIAYGSSLDQIGVLTKDVADAAALLSVIAHHDPRDSTSIREAPAVSAALRPEPLRPLRVGVPAECFGPGLDPEVNAAVSRVISRLEQDGAVVVPIHLPHTEYAVPVYYIIACAEMSSNLARYDGCKYGHRAAGAEEVIGLMTKSRTEGFGEEVKRRIILGTYVLSSGYYEAYYLRATKVRTLIKRDFDQAFEQCDVVINPVAPSPAFKIGEKVSDPLAMYLVDIYSVLANLAGLPAVSVPCGRTRGGLPIGVQLTGRPLAEVDLLRVAREVETWGSPQGSG